MNHVSLIGRLTKEVELKFTSNGTAVGNFTLAVNRNFTNQQGEREADFINCVIWRKSAENLANFTRKGSQIGIEGRIQTRNYESQQGQRVYVTEVVVEQFHLLEPKSITEQRTTENNGSFSGQNNYQGNTQQSNSNSQNSGNFKAETYNYNKDSEMLEGTPIDISEDDLPF